MRRRLLAATVSITLVPLLAALPASPTAALTAGTTFSTAASPSPATPAPTSGKKPRYDATIRWTKHGIPHISAKNFASLGYGSGYAAADASICTLMDTLVTGRGERSRWFGPQRRYDDHVSMNGSNLQVDTLVGDLHNRRVVEKLLVGKAGPKADTRQLVTGYVAGVNRWLRTQKVTDPACRGAGYLRPDLKPIDLYYGVYLANLLASTGVFVKEIADADPPSLTDPGLPELPLRASQVDRDQLLKALGKDPARPFGSNATAVGGAKTSTGKGMLLGNPHFPWRGRYRFTQQHLTIPGRYDVAGASLIGSPAINIGWNKNVAWSHTVSTAYRFTPYEYKLVGSPTTYLTDRGPRQLEHRFVTIKVKRANGSVGTVREDLYRTDQGYVVDSAATLMPWSPASVWAIRDANAEHLRTIDTFLDMGRASSVRDLLRRQDAAGGMSWVNTTAADRKGDVLYADHSVVPHVTDAMKQRCLTPVGLLLDQVAGLPGLDGTFAGSSCAWGTDADAQRPGIFGTKNLPATVRRDWVMNANDSYWLPNPASPLEGYASIIGCERCARTMRTRMVSQYVIDRLRGGRKETPATLASHEHGNRVRAAEVMSVGGDLDEVCAATGETAACAVLKKWDRRSDTTSVGTHLFEEFITRAPADALWEVPFDASDPLGTPRDLAETNPQVVAAMQDAIDFLRSRRVAFGAPWGRLQVAGDRGSPAIPLGGGLGDAAGNANALASRLPRDNTNRFRPITYGSSHIQSIAFLKRGLSARTILTYSQYENPRSPWSADQTRLFSHEKWVTFPWTAQQIRRQLVRTVRLRG
ncbi:penicillin acylase family protein [Nocardioides sp.]|uniref:penicillin acylase family protein n=1 Tax=Nocardioides sp. TaxID=35761 RepID=UPI0027191147|nr:penicillin acylase family protein [Nocardioides sp.]MDO9455369.1 penicillin acylase family protein [Nocardioides sp.]